MNALSEWQRRPFAHTTAPLTLGITSSIPTLESNMQTQKELRERLNADADSIAIDLVSVYGLKFEEEVADLSEPLLRWLDFTTRYISHVPRTVLRSNKFPTAHATEVKAALDLVEQRLTSGQDINPYQSKGLTLYSDTSAAKRQQRTDLLWADWGIHHLHLTTSPILAGDYFSPRSDWLLFCLVGQDSVGLIDIRHHSEKDVFSDPSLLKVVADTWPELMERFRLKGVQAATPANHSAGEVSSLRRAGVTSFVEINNQLYMGPGMGVTTASTPTRVSLASIKIRRYIRELAKVVLAPSGQFLTDLQASGVSNPEFSLALTPNGLSVYEQSSSKAFVLPRRSNISDQSFVSELHDLLAPKWAVDFVMQSAR